MTKPYDLKVDHLRAPIGIGSESPRVSWKLPAGAACTARVSDRGGRLGFRPGRVCPVDWSFRSA